MSSKENSIYNSPINSEREKSEEVKVPPIVVPVSVPPVMATGEFDTHSDHGFQEDDEAIDFTIKTRR